MNLARLFRYAVSGGASAATHVGVGFGMHFWVRPVAASTIGFLASIAVSYALQRAWVFRSAAGHLSTGSKFLTVTAVAFALNATVMWLGTELFRAPYLVAQAVALVAIPAVNYALNSRWTFRPA